MALALIVFIVLVGLGAIAAGRDSRIDEIDRRRRYLG